ncbi:MAG: AHH domain-containing protein [Gemmatimonadaceae bacterium]
MVAKAAKAAAPARDALKRVGMKINDALNGVNLPATKGYVGKAVNHLYMHTEVYYQTVNRLLTNVKTREDAVQVLDMIKQSLLDGSFSH